jgi:hypothetical protein
MAIKWIRTCQSCLHKQEDHKPPQTKELSDSYRNRACKKCRSEDLDYGSEEETKDGEHNNG